jgi:NifU-like protein involved in Fe-S cluster formation
MIAEVAEIYRKLTREGFKNAGSMDSPTLFIDTKAEGVSICGQGRSDFMNIYVKATDGVITDIKYLCSCDPTANVVVEVLCDLVRGMTLQQARTLAKERFYEVIGTDGGSVGRKVWAAIHLMTQVITRYEVAGSRSGETRDVGEESESPAS